jgi:hypothetical protein
VESGEDVALAFPGSEIWIPSPRVTTNVDDPFDTEGTGTAGGAAWHADSTKSAATNVARFMTPIVGLDKEIDRDVGASSPPTFRMG